MLPLAVVQRTGGLGTTALMAHVSVGSLHVGDDAALPAARRGAPGATTPLLTDYFFPVK